MNARIVVVVAQKADAVPLRVEETLRAGAKREVEPVDELTAGRLVDPLVQRTTVLPEVAQQVILAAVAVPDLAHEASSSSSVSCSGETISASLASCHSP